MLTTKTYKIDLNNQIQSQYQPFNDTLEKRICVLLTIERQYSKCITFLEKQYLTCHNSK